MTNTELSLADRVSALEYEMAKLVGAEADLRAANEQLNRENVDEQLHTVIRWLIVRLMIAVPDFDLKALRADLEGALVQPLLPAPETPRAEAVVMESWRRQAGALISECLPESG